MTTQKKTSKRDVTIARLTKELLQFKTMDIMTLAIAHAQAKKLGSDRYMASGVILSAVDLSGKIILEPVMITDGLSADTIAAIRSDIHRTYNGRIQHPTSAIHE